MPTSATYYLNGPTLSSSTAIYSDSNLTIISPDGFYSDGVISREVVGGVLLPPSICNECGTPCSSFINASGSRGVYLINLDAGSTSADIGAVILRFNPASVPDGIRVTYNGNVYNGLTSPLDGFHQSTDPTAFTIIGVDTGTSTCSSWYPSGATLPLNKFLYDGADFNPTGNSQFITINPGDISLSPGPGSVGYCMLVIPKTTATPNVLNVELLGPCSTTLWAIDTFCPELLTGFSSTAMSPTSFDVCSLTETETYYNASLTYTPGIVGLYDFVYSDAFGVNPLAPGFYKATNVISFGNDWFEVDANGVVINLGLCT
jgi:hypothetical protein